MYKIKTNAPESGIIDETELLSRKDHILLFVEQNRKLVLGGVFFIVMAAGIGGGVMWYEHRQTQAAWELEGKAQVHYLDRSLDDAEQSKESVSKAAELYRQILNEYPRTDPARNAVYLLGNSLMEQGDYSGAIGAYQRFFEQYGRNTMLGGLVRQRLAYAYLLNGDKEKALQEFTDILAAPDVYNKDQVLFELAKLDEADGVMDKALNRYQELLEQYPTSPYASEASLRVQVLSPEEEETASTEPADPIKSESTDDESKKAEGE
ncbi:tetratricopeptide repeat protein [Nitrospira sp. M1]